MEENREKLKEQELVEDKQSISNFLEDSTLELSLEKVNLEEPNLTSDLESYSN